MQRKNLLYTDWKVWQIKLAEPHLVKRLSKLIKFCLIYWKEKSRGRNLLNNNWKVWSDILDLFKCAFQGSSQMCVYYETENLLDDLRSKCFEFCQPLESCNCIREVRSLNRDWKGCKQFKNWWKAKGSTSTH